MGDVLNNLIVVTVLDNFAPFYGRLDMSHYTAIENKHILPLGFFASSSFFGAGFGGGGAPLALKKLRMSGIVVM